MVLYIISKENEEMAKTQLWAVSLGERGIPHSHFCMPVQHGRKRQMKDEKNSKFSHVQNCGYPSEKLVLNIYAKLKIQWSMIFEKSPSPILKILLRNNRV